MPHAKDEVCAVGVSGPTYYPEEAVAQSKVLALAELARAMEVKVKVELTVQERGDNRSSETVVMQDSDLLSQVVLKLAQVRAQWTASEGEARYGSKGTVYTLACMPLRDLRAN
jgi:hypothetical protein